MMPHISACYVMTINCILTIFQIHKLVIKNKVEQYHYLLVNTQIFLSHRIIRLRITHSVTLMLTRKKALVLWKKTFKTSIENHSSATDNPDIHVLVDSNKRTKGRKGTNNSK